MDEHNLGLFKGREKPTPEIVYEFYNRGLGFNAQIQLEENVKVNRNFYVGS